MKRNTRADKARETLAIIDQGFYPVEGQQIVIKDRVAHSVDHALLYRPDEFEPVLQDAAMKTTEYRYPARIKVENTTVLKAAAAMALGSGTIGCLNFASAKNPGGGFLGGAQAQEESLALSSALYPTLMKHFEMYEYNRGRHTYLYSDYMIYSPEVLVFRDDEGALLAKPYTMSFVTSPAVNIGAMKQNNPSELADAETTMLCRMDKVLALFIHHGIRHLLLGAWGCGVFQNDPENIARYFASFLLDGGKYSTSFETVVFAVLDRSKDGNNIEAFRKILL